MLAPMRPSPIIPSCICRSLSFRSLLRRTDEFCDRPRLEGASGRAVGCLAIGRLGHRSDPPLGNMGNEPFDEPVSAEPSVASGIEIGTDQPRPHRSLVIGVIA